MAVKTIRQQVYLYKGKNERGIVTKGEITAGSIAQAKALLRKQGVTPTRISKRSVLSAPLFLKKRIKPRDITFFTRQLATMLSSGIPLVQSFDIIARGLTNPTLQALVNGVRTKVEEGRSLAEALQGHPNYFSDLYCNLVAAGEQSGSLDNILSKLATQKEKMDSIKAKVQKALFYPVAVICVALVVSAILLIFVVPQFENLFKNFGAQLPLFTRLVLGLSRFAIHYGWWIMGGIGIVVSGFIYAKKRSVAFSNQVERIMLKLPIFGTLLEKAAIARFSRTLSITYAAGVPLVDGLHAVAKATGNVIYAKATEQMGVDIAKGQQLQLAMRQAALFPELVIQMVAIGEESGALEEMLGKVADFYEEEVGNRVDSLSSLLEPLIISILGVMVGGLVIAMYLPIFQLGSVV